MARSLSAEYKLLFGIHGLRYAIGIQNERIPGLQHGGFCLVPGLLIDPQSRSRRYSEPFSGLPRAHEERRQMARVGVAKLTRGKVENTAKRCDKHHGIIIAAQLQVNPSEDFGKFQVRSIMPAIPLMRVLVTAMNSAAGMPLPETSPMVKSSRPSSSRKKS